MTKKYVLIDCWRVLYAEVFPQATEKYKRPAMRGHFGGFNLQPPIVGVKQGMYANFLQTLGKFKNTVRYQILLWPFHKRRFQKCGSIQWVGQY